VYLVYLAACPARVAVPGRPDRLIEWELAQGTATSPLPFGSGAATVRQRWTQVPLGVKRERGKPHSIRTDSGLNRAPPGYRAEAD
jgi:hypothetical protein